MSFANRISQTLHEEHRATIALMERLEQLLARHRRGAPPDTGERGVSRLMADLSTGVEAEVQRHFAFEENRLFAYLDEFRRLGGELVERMLAHVQKEEMALLPLLEDGMDAETEARLYQEYTESQ